MAISYSTSINEGFVTIRGRGTGRYQTNQQPSLAIAGDGTWVVGWTQATREAHPDQRVVCSVSADGGESWSEDVVIEDASPDGRNASWAMLFAVPTSTRVYAFYWWNENANPQRDAGRIHFRYSDDAGRSWSPRFVTPMPRHDIDEPGHDSHGWNTGFPILLRNGQMLLGFSKISPRTPPNTNPDRWHTECFLLIAENILTESDPARLSFAVTPEGRQGLWAPHPDLPTPFAQEPYMANLPDGSVIATMRTRTGYPYYSISHDYGRTWTPAAPLRQCPGGARFLQPCGPCPVTSLSDGRVAFFFNNVQAGLGAADDFWGKYWVPRDPFYVAIGRQCPAMAEAFPEEQRNGGLVFTYPRLFLQGGPGECAAYPQFVEVSGRYFALYANTKLDIRIKEIPAHYFSDYGLPR